MEPKITLLPICFKIAAMHLVCCSSLRIWRRSPLEKGPLNELFCPALDPPRAEFAEKPKHRPIRDHEHFISTKFHKHQSSGSVGKTDYRYVFKYIYMHKYTPPSFIPTKFCKLQSSGSVEKADYVFQYINLH